MSKTRYINTKFWSDPWVVDHLNPLDRHLFFYFLTNEHTTIAGVYELSLRTISLEIGIEREELIRMIKRLEPKIRYMDSWVVIANAIKNQNYKSPRIKTGIDMVLERCPPELLDYINLPDDFGKRPSGSKQQKLIVEEMESFDVKDKKQAGHPKNVVTSYNSGVSEVTTPTPVLEGIHTLSHSNTNSRAKSKPTVNAPEPVDKRPTGAATTGKNYFEINLLYDDLLDLTNDSFKAWYCKVFYKLGVERVRVLASQARADGKNPKRLFSHLLQEASGIKQGSKV